MPPMSMDWRNSSGLGTVCGLPPQISMARSEKMNSRPKVSRVCGISFRCSGRSKNRSMSTPSRAMARLPSRTARTKLLVVCSTASPT